MTDRVEGCGEIDANKQCDFLAVSRGVDAVKDIKQRRLGRMSLPVGRLPLAEVLGVGEVGTQACHHKSLEHLGYCRQVRYRPVVDWQRPVEPRLPQ